MLEQGFNWFALTQENPEAEQRRYKINYNRNIYTFQKYGKRNQPHLQLHIWIYMDRIPTDTFDVELTIRTVKGIYTYRKDHAAESTVFSPWSRTIIPVPSLQRKIQAYQDKKNKKTSAWNKVHAVPYFPTQHHPKHRHTSEKTRTRWSNQRHRFNPIKTEHYNTQDREMTDFRKVDMIKPTPK